MVKCLKYFPGRVWALRINLNVEYMGGNLPVTQPQKAEMGSPRLATPICEWALSLIQSFSLNE